MEAIHSLLPTDNVVIDDINDEFYDAIQHLRKQDVIGLALEEFECDRYGDLEWLSVSTPMCTFIFDIQKLQKIAFREGLKTILENPRIVKILHDCRRPSDCLFHQYDTKLSNIYDTQVADFVANVQKVNLSNISRSVNTLYHCLASHLKIPEEFFNPRPIKSDYSLRPIKPNVKDFLIKNVIYLRLLKKELDIILRMPYRRCVDIYMQSVLRKSDGEMKLCPPELATVPPEMVIEGMKVFQITDQLPENGALLQKKEMSENNQYRYEESGYGNIVDNHFSRDFDRTEVIKFLMERMFYGKNLDNDAAHSIESDRYSVKSADVVSSHPVSPAQNIEVSLSTLSKLKELLPIPSRQSDSKLFPFENRDASDTSSSKGRSEKSLAMSKTIDLVRHLKLKSAPRNNDEKSKQSSEGSSLVELAGNSTIHNRRSMQTKLQEEPHRSKESNNNLVETSNFLKCIDGEDPISIVTSKDISPSDRYKYIMSNRSKASSKKSSMSDSNGHISSRHSEKSSNASDVCEIEKSSEHFSCFPSRESANMKQKINEGLSDFRMKESVVADYDKSSSPEPDEMQNVIDDPWEKLRSAFDVLGPQRPIKKSLFVPAGMNC